MKTNVSFKISKTSGCWTYINEYWDDILVFKWKVHKIYRGGSLPEFIKSNNSSRIPNFDGIDEYLRRTYILKF